jgi:hypothetical protein
MGLAAVRTRRPIVDIEPTPPRASYAAQREERAPSSTSGIRESGSSMGPLARTLTHGDRFDHFGYAARRFSIHPGVLPGKVTSADRALRPRLHDGCLTKNHRLAGVKLKEKANMQIDELLTVLCFQDL